MPTGFSPYFIIWHSGSSLKSYLRVPRDKPSKSGLFIQGNTEHTYIAASCILAYPNPTQLKVPCLKTQCRTASSLKLLKDIRTVKKETNGCKRHLHGNLQDLVTEQLREAGYNCLCSVHWHTSLKKSLHQLLISLSLPFTSQCGVLLLCHQNWLYPSCQWLY